MTDQHAARCDTSIKQRADESEDRVEYALRRTTGCLERGTAQVRDSHGAVDDKSRCPEHRVQQHVSAYGERFTTTLAKYPGVPVSPPESIGPAIVWLVGSPDADRFLPKRVNLPGLTHKQGLLPGWDGPGTVYATA